jgi:hypothetical protein
LYRQARQCHDAFVQIIAVPQRGQGGSFEAPGSVRACWVEVFGFDVIR